MCDNEQNIKATREERDKVEDFQSEGSYHNSTETWAKNNDNACKIKAVEVEFNYKKCQMRQN
jgi:hypothetical protein